MQGPSRFQDQNHVALVTLGHGLLQKLLSVQSVMQAHGRRWSVHPLATRVLYVTQVRFHRSLGPRHPQAASPVLLASIRCMALRAAWNVMQAYGHP